MSYEVLDSRFWNGVVPQDAAASFRAFIGKATETHGAGRHYTLVNHLLPQQFDGARKAGWRVGAWHYHIEAGDPTVSAREYYRFMRALGMDFPPILDVEDEEATGAHVWATVQAIEQRFGERCLIYAARWAWDESNYLPPAHPIFTRDLWEADPPPATPSPGYFGEPVMVQYALDVLISGFRSVSGGGATMDRSRVDEVWYAANVRPRFMAEPGGPAPIVVVKYPVGSVDVRLEGS